MEEQLTYELMDRYLAGDLSDPERIAFEERCKNDQPFAEAFKLHVKAEYASRLAAREARKGSFREMYLQEQPEKVQVRSFRPYFAMAVAAAIALLILIGISIIRTPDTGTFTNQELYAQHMSFSVSEFPESRNQSNQDLAWSNTVKAFEEGDFEQTIHMGQNLLSDSSVYVSRVNLLTGISYLELRENASPNETDSVLDSYTQNAIVALNGVSTSSKYRFDVPWYKALAYVQKGDRESAIPFLKAIEAVENHPHREAAMELLEQLNK